jgi:PAS domain S-box-containing protein
MKHQTAESRQTAEPVDGAETTGHPGEPAIWRAAFAHSPLPMILHDVDGAILDVNHSFVSMTGYSLADVPDATAWLRLLRRVPDSERDSVLSDALEPYRSGVAQLGKVIDIWTSAGVHRRWRLFSSEPYTQGDGRRLVITTGQDVTDVEAAERELVESRERIGAQLAELEALYSAAPVGLQMLDRDLRVVRINEALAELNGFSVAEHVGRNIFDIVPDARSVAEPLLRRVLETGEPVIDFELEGETAKAPGVVRTWNELFYPVKDQTGEATGIGVICLETTERTASDRRLAALNRALAESLHRFEVVTRAAQIVVFAQDAQRRYTFISEARWGRSRDEAVGLRDEELLPPDVAGPTIALKDEVLATGQSRQCDMRVDIDGREMWWHKRVEPVLGEDGTVAGLVGVSIDITDRKQRENQVETLMLELAHRSKNLLAVIQGMARHSRGRVATVDEFLASFEGRLKSLAQSHDILAREGWSGAGIGDLVSSQLGHYPEMLGSRVVQRGPALLLLPAAAQNIGMALHELSTNALKYGALSNGGGRVDIEWRVEPGGAGEEDRFVLEWRESGGPPVRPEMVQQRGFGRVVTELIVSRAVHGQATWNPAPTGVTWRLEAALPWVAATAAGE